MSRLRAGLPVEHEEALLDRLRAAEPACLRNQPQRLLRVDSVPDEPRADDDPGAPAAGPAVDVDEAAGRQLVVDLVERRDELCKIGNREVRDRTIHVARPRSDQGRVRLELALLREVEEERHARREQVVDLVAGVLRPERRRMSTRDQASRLDHRRWPHDVQSDLVSYLVRGDRLNRGRAGADRRHMSPAATSANELRDTALDLVAASGVDSGAWYVRVLEEGKRENVEPDLGALVRAYWELQRVTGRADLRDTWRALADQLWSPEAA